VVVVVVPYMLWYGLDLGRAVVVEDSVAAILNSEVVIKSTSNSWALETADTDDEKPVVFRVE